MLGWLFGGEKEEKAEIINKRVAEWEEKDFGRMWKYKTGGIVYSVSITSDGNYITAGGVDENIYLFDRNGNLLWKYKTGGIVYSVSITSDGNYITAGGEDGNIYLFDRNGNLLWKYKTGGIVYSVSITSDGNYITAGGEDGNIYLFDRNGNLLWKYKTGGGVASVSITSDGNYITAGGEDGNIYLFDRNGNLLWKYKTGGIVVSVSITSDGNYITAGGVDENIYLFDRNGNLLWKYKTGGIVYSVSITSDGNYITAGGEDGNIYLFDRNGNLLWKYKTGGIVYSVSITSDGNYITAGGEDGNIYLFNMELLIKQYTTTTLEETISLGKKLGLEVRLLQEAENLLSNVKTKRNIAIFEVSKAVRILEETIEKAKPEIELKPEVKPLTLNRWDVLKINVENKGLAKALDLILEFPEDFEVRRVKPLEVKAKDSVSLEIPVRPKVSGRVPLDIKVKFKDGKGREYEESFEEWVEVIDAMVTPVTPPQPQPQAFSPKKLGEYEGPVKELFNEFLNWREPFLNLPMNEWYQKRKEVYDKYRKLFLEKLEEMTPQDFERFLDFQENLSWTGLYRRGKEATKDMDKLREGIRFLLNEELPVSLRIRETVGLGGRYKVRGMGKNLATAILHVCYPHKYGVWNNPSEEGLKILNMLPRRSSDLGESYEKINSSLINLSKVLNIDLTMVDMFLYYLAREEREREKSQPKIVEVKEVPKLSELVEKAILDIGESDPRKVFEWIKSKYPEVKVSYGSVYLAVTGKTPESKRKPEVNLSLINKDLSLAKWNRVSFEIENKSREDLTLILSFSDEVEVRGNKRLSLKAEETKTITLGMKPRDEGELPIEIKVNLKDKKGNSYEKVFTEWISVGKEEKLTPQDFTPKPITPKTFPQELQEYYENPEFIGKGGFARVFKCRRKRDNKTVAVKIPISLDPATGRSFVKELQNWTKLEHENIVRVYDYNVLPIPYFEMEFCDSSLDKLAKPIEIERAAWLIFNIAEGLKYAHKLKIIHRDLKPQNILLSKGVPKISDWGLSKVLAESTTSTTTAFTPYYASPEQISGDVKDERTDIFQLGIIFYELVTGELPFKGDNLVEIGMAIATKQPALPSEINPEAKDVEDIIMKCLEKEKEKRYQNVKELQKDLAEYLKIEYTKSLRESLSRKDFSRSGYYCGELLLINLKLGLAEEAWKYALDYKKYVGKEFKKEVEKICEHLKYCLENEIEISEEIVKKASVFVHRVRMG